MLVRIPGRVVVVVGPGHAVGRGLEELRVVVPVGLLVDDAPVADHEQAVDVAVLAARELRVEAIQDGRVEPLGLRRRHGPALRRPGRALGRQREGRREEQDHGRLEAPASVGQFTIAPIGARSVGARSTRKRWPVASTS